MFGIGIPEFGLLFVIALFVFGPDKLPEVARQAGRFVRQARQMATSARAQVAEELGPEFANLDLRDLTPRALLQKHVLNDLDDDDPAQRPGHRPLGKAEQAPFDVEAT